MILDKNNISTYKVGSALGSSSRDVGTLCTSPLVNMWSKWKPIESPTDTMTSEELIDKRYGLKVLESNTVSDLINKIKQNNNIGVTYEKPRTKYRLGDFRNYNSTAPVTVETSKDLYIDGKVNVGGVTDNNHGSYEILIQGVETQGTESTIGVEDLYHFIDSNGQDIAVRRGAYVTDGTHSEWYTDKLCWWTTQMQQFRNKTVDVYEFYTNTTKQHNTYYQPNYNDRFYALPEPHFQLKVEDKTPAGSRKVATMLQAEFVAAQSPTAQYDNVSWSVYFDAKGEVYRGGTIENVWIKLCRDKKGIDVIEQKLLVNSLNVPDETQSKTYQGTFRNRAANMNEQPSPNVWIIVWFDYALQSQAMPMMQRPDHQRSYIIRPE